MIRELKEALKAASVAHAAVVADKDCKIRDLEESLRIVKLSHATAVEDKDSKSKNFEDSAVERAHLEYEEHEALSQPKEACKMARIAIGEEKAAEHPGGHTTQSTGIPSGVQGHMPGRHDRLAPLHAPSEIKISETAVVRAGWSKEYGTKMEADLLSMCHKLLALTDGIPIDKDSDVVSKIFYHKMKADFYRYIAEFSEGDEKTKAVEKAHLEYVEASQVAEKDLAVTHPVRLGLALNCSVFQYRVAREKVIP